MRAAELMKAALLARGDQPVLYEMNGRTISGRDLVGTIERVAGRLLAGRPKDGIVGVWYRNCLEAVVAFLAVEWAGMTRITVDPNAQPPEAKATFAAGGADFILADAEHANLLDGAGTIYDRGTTFFGEPAPPQPVLNMRRPLSVYPRSVSNGKLFAIPFSYANWDALLRINVALYRGDSYGPWNEDREVLLAAQQIMHATGLVGTFPFLLMGRPQVLVDRFAAEQVIDSIDQFQITTTFLVPQMLTRLVELAKHRPGTAATLRHVLYGGGPVQIEDVRDALARLGPVLSQVYGRMEGGWPIAILNPTDHETITAVDNGLAASCGRPIAQVDVRLRPVGKNDRSKLELLVASEMNVADYTDPDGYCALGDIVERDDKGYLFYRGRLDRMINTGYHVYPAEIEELIANISGVADVLVVGESNREWGETVVAYLVAKPGAESGASLLARVQSDLEGKLAKYKVPKEFRLVEKLPAN
jgi:acyl-CoA synthetase (AMP-forming)/AMP-acid ligase II